MNRKLIATAVIILAIAALALVVSNKPVQKQPLGNMPASGESAPETTGVSDNQPVKEFSMDSWSEQGADGKWKPQFSLKEISVKKGDKVKININVKSGRHDFKIDELNVYKDTPTGQVTTVEFAADKIGEFVYYCNQPGHRALGHWGTLKVTE